jgi:crotonobetainyl-CoA:carnitine CoA-transferase CaiB-like acyl-CoA transferase
VRAVRSPARFSRTEPELWRHPPDLGQHTDEILGEFGFGAGEISELRANRIVN